MPSYWSAGEDHVIPAPPRLEEIPPVDEREIVAVHLKQTGGRGVNLGPPLKECQGCGDAVERREEHVLASVWADSTTGRILHKPVFCGRDCWLNWLS